MFRPAATLRAQNTGPQQLSFAGLRAVANQGQINAVKVDPQGNLYLLIDQKDGVRLIKTDAAAATLLAQAQLGAQGDIGLAMALDPTGNVYITGTTTSGQLTSTSGAAFRFVSGSSTNSFIAKFNTNLIPLFVTFAGGGFMAASSIAATSDAVFIAGSVFAPTLPVTPAAIIQLPAYGSTQNGFVEKISTGGSTLLYATYLSGANGNTAATAIAADASDNAYIAGSTTAPGYPTIAALVPEALGATSGFLTKLTPAGDGITFSTYIPGAGITALAIDPAAANLLLSGSVSLGQFPVAAVTTPLTAVEYQVLLRLPLDGSSVLASTLLAPGTQSFVVAGPAGTAWVDGSLSLPLLPLAPLSTIGNSFAMHVNAANVIDQTARFGGIAASNPNSASAPVTLTSIAVDASGNPIIAGSFSPTASQSLLATPTFDLPLENAPTAAFPSTVRAAVLPSAACNGSLCAGSAAYLAKLTIPANAAAATASLSLSVDDSPNLTLRNLATAEATHLQLSLTGFTFATDCASTLAAGADCAIALTGSGPGSVTVSAGNAVTQTQALSALPATTAPLAVVFSPKRLDFGIVSSASGSVSRTITVTNLTQQSQTFTSALDISAQTTLPYTFAEIASDCTVAGAATIKLLAPESACHITVGLIASNLAANDGPIRQNWRIATRDVQLTAYAQAASLSLSAAEIDFGTLYTGGLRLPRYLYLSNNSTVATEHAAVTLPATSSFSVVDACPSVLEPLSVCQLRLAYLPTRTPAADSATLSLDQGLTALITGRSLPQPSANGTSVNPNLSVSATSLSFANAVAVTGVSSSTQTLTIQNTGASPFTLSLLLTGDFRNTTNCGATLAGGASCSMVFSFAPSQPGTRQGLLAIIAGAGTTPTYVTLSAIATGILSPANNGTLNFGSVATGQPVVQWIKITQAFTSFSVATASATLGLPFGAILIEDIGYGHGQPATTAFASSASGTCYNCWLGVEFTPPATGMETGTLTLTSTTSGNPYVLSLAGTGLPLAGLLLTPIAQDFGPVPINSVSGSMQFELTNLAPTAAPVTVATPTLSGDFLISNNTTGGSACAGPLAYTASCFIEVSFAPSTPGPRTGSLTLQAGSLTASATLTGYGSPDPGVALSPTALIFTNVPGRTSTAQIVTVTNTSTTTEQIGTPVALTSTPALPSFSAASNCSTLAAGSSCSITVTFTPASAPAAGTLQIPVTSSLGGSPVLTTYAVPLTSAYTTEDAGLEIVAADAEYGPQATGAIGVTQQFTINNLTAKPLTLDIALPRQFVLSGPPCSGLAAYASCNFSVSFLPLTNGDITGTLFAQGTPTDGSTTLDGLGYVEGYGVGAGSLAVSGGILPGGVLNFGQVPSGQSAQKILTLTNSSPTTPLTIRRVTSQWPFTDTTTCGATLPPAANCTLTLTYSPINQVAPGSSPPPFTTDTGTLIIESDANSSPDLIDLTGNSTPIAAASPSNTGPLAALTASANSLTFANTMVGTASSPQTVTLDNTGNATIRILNLQAPSDFAFTSTCSAIVPGASCVLTATFTPQAATQPGSGTRIGAIEISSDASTSLEFISLAAVSSPSTLSLAPTSLTFAPILVGASATLTLQLTNTAATPATITSIATTGDYSAATATGTCPASGGSLAPAAICTLPISFNPTQPGTRLGTLSIASSATTLPLTVPLTGSAIQSHLQVSPANLAFSSVATGSSASLSLTLLNNGSAPIAAIALTVTGDYTVSVPCAVATLAPGGSCSVTIQFTPSTAGPRTGTLTIASSDAASPVAIPLTGTGSNLAVTGSFTLTANGAAVASAMVSNGDPATYTLALTPTGSFTGTVILNCTPIVAAQYATCSLLPSSITLGSTHTSVATLTTVTSVASASAATYPTKPRNFRDTYLCLLIPGLILSWKARTSRHPAWRRDGPLAWAIFAAIALLTTNGCGGGSSSPSSLRYSTPGSYQYQVTASSISNGIAITQTVTLNLTVQ